MIKPIISIVIPTYIRPELLRIAITSLIKQTAQSRFEIIVVDNDPKASAKPVAMSFNRKSLIYIRESRIGHSIAKNAGLKIARGLYCLFLDDDAKVGPDFIANALSQIEKRKSPMVFGGPIKPYFPEGKPAWFKSSYETRTFGSKAKALSTAEFLPTSSTFINTKILKKIGGFNPDYGIRGGRRRFGEDTDVLRRLRRQDPSLQIWYDPQLVVYHATPKTKTSLAYRSKHLFHLGASGVAVTGERLSLFNKISKAVLAVGVILFSGLVSLPLRDKKKYPYWQQVVYEKIAPQYYWFGLLLSRNDKL